MKRYTHILIIIMITALAISCNMETDGRDYLGDEDSSNTDSDGDSVDAVELSDTENSNTYAMQEKLYVKLDIFHDGTLIEDMVITNVFLATIDTNGTLHRNACMVDMSEVLSAKTYVENSTVTTLDVDDTENFIDSNGDISVQNHTWLWGWHADDPVNESLPSSTDDTRIFDQDNDGHPGITVVVKNSHGNELGKRYFIRRAIKNYSGRVDESGDWISGNITFTVEDFVIDGTSNMVKTAPITTPDNDKPSTFIMRKIPEGKDCEYINEQGEGLFVKE